MLLGKAVRQERILDRNTHRTIIVPLDHGVTVGPIYGLVDFKGTVNRVAEGGANAVLMHKGLPRCTHRGYGKDVGLILHLSASTSLSPTPNSKTLVGTVKEAIKMGADAVSVHVNLGDEREDRMLSDLGDVTAKAGEWGIPVLAMVYARGPKVKNEYDPEIVRHCARVGQELGADIIKVVYTGSVETFSRVVESCCVPVVIAGGEKMENEEELVRMVYDSITAGGAGLFIGRNVFQAEDPVRLVGALNMVVHQDADVKQAMRYLQSES